MSESADARIDVAIVGAGFCGAVLATRLACGSSQRVALFERGAFACGVAYAAPTPRFLLNLPAGKMSAFPERPGDFVTWTGDAGADDFLPRARYAGYLRATFERATAEAANVARIAEAVVEISRDGNGYVVHGERTRVRAKRVVLALGVFPPLERFAGAQTRDHPRYAANPWSAPFERLSGRVVSIGSGLTAVDLAVELHHRRFDGELVMISRHGLLPQVHRAYDEPVETEFDMDSALLLLRSIRRNAARVEAAGGDWRAVVDAVRPLTPRIWQTWSTRERRRYLRHLRAFWETRRRRMPPQAGKALDALASEGRLRRIAGKVRHVEPIADDRLSVRFRRAGVEQQLDAGWVINCTGPAGDLAAVDDPLVRSLLRKGLIRRHETGMGLDATPQGEVVARDGTLSPNLFALGSLLRGVLYESVSVGELNAQVRAMADRLGASGDI